MPEANLSNKKYAGVIVRHRGVCRCGRLPCVIIRNDRGLFYCQSLVTQLLICRVCRTLRDHNSFIKKIPTLVYFKILMNGNVNSPLWCKATALISALRHLQGEHPPMSRQTKFPNARQILKSVNNFINNGNFEAFLIHLNFEFLWGIFSVVWNLFPVPWTSLRFVVNDELLLIKHFGM